jgi:two-component system response regulator HydG
VSDAVAPRVLIVEDDVEVRALLLDLLGHAGYRTDWVGAGDEALRTMEGELYDVVLLDLRLPGIDGMGVLTAAPSVQPDAQFIVMTAFGATDTAVQAMKLGAFDYLTKPFDIDELTLTVARAVRESESRRELARLRRASAVGPLAQLIGRSAAMQRLRDLIERVAPTRASVLITGETGTGKELVARAIHALSDRSRGPFTPVQCSALPETLLESELFGHLKGSFTGAMANRRGLFEEANRGTLFLDEVSTIAAATQVKLLRVLQERLVLRVGGGSPVPVDFRLVTATNEGLDGEVSAGRFREDLYYRLKVVPIEVPPLRERRSDIPLLANHFRLQCAAELGVPVREFANEVLPRLEEHDWPGNVRELRNYVERAMIMHDGGRQIAAVPLDAARAPGGAPRSDRPDGGADGQHPSARAPDSTGLARGVEDRWSLERMEREYILAVLDEAQGNRSRAAEVLGINRRTLHRKLEQYRGASERTRGDGA